MVLFHCFIHFHKAPDSGSLGSALASASGRSGSRGDRLCHHYVLGLLLQKVDAACVPLAHGYTRGVGLHHTEPCMLHVLMPCQHGTCTHAHAIKLQIYKCTSRACRTRHAHAMHTPRHAHAMHTPRTHRAHATCTCTRHAHAIHTPCTHLDHVEPARGVLPREAGPS